MTGITSARANVASAGHFNGDSDRLRSVTQRGIMQRIDAMLENSRSSSRSRRLLADLHAAR